MNNKNKKKAAQKTEYKKVKSKIDNFTNIITGLNAANSKNKANQLEKQPDLSYDELDTLLRDSKICKRACLKPAEEILKRPLVFHIDDPKQKEIMSNAFKKFDDSILKALFFEAGFGGGAVILDIRDNKALDQPVNINDITALGFTGLMVLDKKYIEIKDYNVFSQPEAFYIKKDDTETKTLIHADRVLFFNGAAATINERKKNKGFSDSLLQSMFKAIESYIVVNQYTAELIHEFSQTVFSIDGLNAMFEDEETKDIIVDRALYMNALRSILNGIFIDGNDKFYRETANLSGLKDFVSISKEFLQANSDLPVMILLNEKPEGGLSDTGKSSLIQYYDYIVRNQTRITPEINKLISYIAAAEKIAPPLWSWSNIWELDDKETADLDNKKADTFNKIVTGLKTLWESDAISGDELNSLITKQDSFFSSMAQKAKNLIGALAWQK